MHIIEHDEIDLCLVVAARHDVAEEVVALELRDAAGNLLPRWSPGAHVDLKLAPGVTRQYSLCGDPEDRATWRIGVLLEKESRGGSSFVHEKLQVGDEIQARGPRNNFVLDAAPSYVFVAGGIGITPIIPMIAAASARGASWELHYGGRTLDSMAFRDEVLEVGSTGDRVHLHPQDVSGLLDLDAILGPPRQDTLVYCCGPEPLLRAVEEHCSDWPSSAVRFERFAAVVQPESATSEAFEVVLAASGMTLTVPPGQSILEVVTEAGIEVDSSCAEGICGTCETAVVEGEIEHRDSLLSSDERAANDVMFICVSRAACPRITIDL